MSTLEGRFWAKVDKSGDCWLWTAAKTFGYGKVGLGGRQDGVDWAHRVSYRLLVGPIPDGMTLDHLCHTNDPDCPGGECWHRACVNPAHLEVVTLTENKRRGRGWGWANKRAKAGR